MVMCQYAIRCAPAVVVALATISASGQTNDAADAISQVSVVPRHNQWSLVDPQQRQALSKTVGMPAADRDQLIRRGDARERGIGIFIAEQQGDIELLLSLAHLLADGEPTVPYALATALPGEYAHEAQTVAEYLSSVYLEWFGVDVDQSAKRFDKLLGAVTDPSRLVRPWIVRLRRARGDSQATTPIKQGIRKLPEEVRWAIVTLGYCNSLYTEPQARALLSELSETTQDAIQNERSLLPEEPLFRMNAGTYRKLALGECQRLLSPSDDQ